MSSGSSAVDLRRRATDPESLDEGVPEREALASLADLRFVGRWLGGRRAVVRRLVGLLEGAPRPSLLDVGCGSADLASLVRRACPTPVTVVGIDLKALHLRTVPTGIHPVVADVRRLPFADSTFDVAYASLFLHHFDGDEPSLVLRELARVAKRAVVVDDLVRARVPYWFGQTCFRWIFRSQVSIDDGLLSIRRAFTAGELEAAFRAAGLTRLRVQKRFPYRLLAVADLAN